MSRYGELLLRAAEKLREILDDEAERQAIVPQGDGPMPVCEPIGIRMAPLRRKIRYTALAHGIEACAVVSACGVRGYSWLMQSCGGEGGNDACRRILRRVIDRYGLDHEEPATMPRRL